MAGWAREPEASRRLRLGVKRSARMRLHIATTRQNNAVELTQEYPIVDG